MVYFLKLLALVAFVSASAHAERPVAAQSVLSPDFETYVHSLMDHTRTPGVAVGVVKDGELVYAKGFGLRNIQDQLPVTPETLFAIGSTTKALTAASVALMVERGVVDWQTPVRNYEPLFRLQDTYASENATFVDLLAHRTGLPRHDLAWYGAENQSREDLIALLPHLPPSTTFRNQWQYQNLMYTAAGWIVGRLSGQTWEQLVEQYIFEPLGMSHSVFTIEEMTSSQDHSRPYHVAAGAQQATEIPYRPIVGMAPAGAINSNVRDLARWLALQMNQGQWDGQSILSPESLAQLHRPQMVLPEPMSDRPEFGHPSYALGWFVQTYRNHRWIWHSGGIDGFVSHVGFMPDQKVGVVVLTNTASVDLALPIALGAYDELLHLEPKDWPKLLATGKSQPAPPAIEPQPLQRSAEDYVGLYVHRAYGTIEVYLQSDGSLHVRYHGFDLPLVHTGYGTFAPVPESDILPQLPKMVFQVNTSGQVEALQWQVEPALAPLEFVKDRS